MSNILLIFFQTIVNSSEEENINLKKYFMNYLLIEITVSPRSLESVKLMTLDMIINQY